MSSIKVWDYWAGKYESLWVQKYSLSPTRRDIIKEIKKLIGPGTSCSILDMGCGTGQLIRDMQNEFKGFDIKYTGVDFSPEMINIAKSTTEGCDFFNCSVDDFSAPEGSFDIIVCSHSFPYYPNKGAAIDKLHSLLKVDGCLLLAQASANSLYDNIAMFFVKFTTGSAKYLSVKNIKTLVQNKFKLVRVHWIKEKFYMPSICLFLLKKEGKNQ